MMAVETAALVQRGVSEPAVEAAACTIAGGGGSAAVPRRGPKVPGVIRVAEGRNNAPIKWAYQGKALMS